MPNTINPAAISTPTQQNTGTEPGDLAQSQYDFSYKVFPGDLGMDNNGHYMVININVPTNFNRTAPRGSDLTLRQFTFLPDSPQNYSTVDKLRNLTGSLNYGWKVGGEENNRPTFAIPRRTRRIAQSIALHMPTPLIYNTHNAYEEISLSALGFKLGASGLTAIASTVTAAIGKTIDAGLAAGALAGRAISKGVQAVSTASKLLQSPINPAVEILFSNTLVRQFTLEVMMAPRNEQESLDMKEIIKTLRFHGAPEIAGDQIDLTGVGLGKYGSGLFWIPPAEFDITFFNKGVENMNILRINTCVLERIEVDYAPTGIYSTFRNGHPVAARLSLGFRELEPVHKKRVLQGF